jgi:hypothetical protein
MMQGINKGTEQMSDDRIENYTRVTNILSMYSDYDSIPEAILQRAAGRGQLIHSLCELYARDGIRMPSEFEGYVDGFVKWFEREKVEVYELETRLFCETFEITGQYDMYVKLENGDDYIIDIKTCAAKHKTWPVQLAAYQYLFDVNKEGTLPRRAVLHLKKDGKYGFYAYDNDDKDRDLFMSCLKLHRYFKKD